MKRETARELCNSIQDTVKEATVRRRNEVRTDDDGSLIKQDTVLGDYIPSKRVYEVVARPSLYESYEGENMRTQLFLSCDALPQTEDLSIDFSFDGEDLDGRPVVEVILHNRKGDELRPMEQEMYDVYSGLQEVITSSEAANIAVQYKTWDELKCALEKDLRDIPGVGPSRARAVKRYVRFKKSDGSRPLGEDIPSSGVL